MFRIITENQIEEYINSYSIVIIVIVIPFVIDKVEINVSVMKSDLFWWSYIYICQDSYLIL